MGKWSVVFLLLALVSCTKDEPAVQKPTPYEIAVPPFFPTVLNIPADNPMTVEGVALGRALFYDGHMSGRTEADSMMSCFTCHIQAHSFECGITNPAFANGHPHGLTGIPTPHTMLPMINLVWTSTGYLWNGFVEPGNPDPSKRELEDLVWMGVVAPHEMAGDTNRVKALIQADERYPGMFEAAFGSRTVTMKNISRAVAQFVRTLVSSDSKFDRFLRGQAQLNPSELNGYVLFMTEQGADCFHCHGGDGNPLFTTNLYYNNGKDAEFTDTRDRYHITFQPADIGAYKAPTLRNLAFTAPYMHDGRFSTLDEVIDFYSSGLIYSPYVSPLMHHIATGGNMLTPSEKADLKAFLLTLSDSSFVTNPAFGPPQ